MTKSIGGHVASHATSSIDVVALLRSDAEAGLDEAEAQRRLAEGSRNELPDAPLRGPIARAWAQFNNPLILVLIAAGAITLALQDYVDSAVIFGVVLINAAIGFIQEGKAESALAAVRSMLANVADVVRDRRRREIPAADLVVGDVVLLEAGDRVPADLRLIAVRNLLVDESALTGESVAAEKADLAVNDDAPLGDRVGMAYSGTLVTSGTARGVVVATGRNTEVGRIGALVGGAGTLATPLTRALDQFARRITVVILIVSVAAFGFATLVDGRDVMESFLAVVGLAVAAIPEGLPAIITIILAIGTRVLARNRAIIRRLPAVETLGSVSVICTDKTGTLTRNEMTVVRLLLHDADVEVSGAGYEPVGDFTVGDRQLNDEQKRAVTALCRAAMLCNDASVHEGSDGIWQAVGDPMEAALVTVGRKFGIDHDDVIEECPRSDEIPFDPSLRLMVTAHEVSADAPRVLFVKGAPEEVLRMCANEDEDRWHGVVSEAAGRGERVLAFAVCESSAVDGPLQHETLPDGWQLLGMVSLMDPPRPEAIDSIAVCRTAGIRVIMITGDHAATAAAIGAQLGLGASSALTGNDIQSMDDAALRRALESHDVIARANPEDKMRLVSVLQESGSYVAMTGDGVNDAPALKSADIGVAMGGRGTDAARDASDLVLTDDNFATITQAVREGRVVFENVRKSLRFVLPTNGGQGGLILLALLIGLTLPVTVAQILWVNMVTTVTLALALAFEPGEKGVMQQAPRPKGEPLVTRGMLAQITYVSVIIIMVTLAAFSWELSRGSTIEVARTAAVNALVAAELLYLFNVRRLRTSSFHISTFTGNRAALIAAGILVILQLAFTYAPPMQVLFSTAPLDLASWMVIAALAIGMFVIVGLEKQILLNKKSRG
jgi:magnesium-transporting ATPase (P-type)